MNVRWLSSHARLIPLSPIARDCRPSFVSLPKETIVQPSSSPRTWQVIKLRSLSLAGNLRTVLAKAGRCSSHGLDGCIAGRTRRMFVTVPSSDCLAALSVNIVHAQRTVAGIACVFRRRACVLRASRTQNTWRADAGAIRSLDERAHGGGAGAVD